MKIAVYTICKNEEKFLNKFMNSCDDADYVLICDTGSTDKTIEKLEQWEVTCRLRTLAKRKFKWHSINVSPWRFDDARNVSLNLLPEDIDVCICLDMDEILVPGWRDIIEKAWEADTDRLRYNYIWSWNADGTPGLTYHADKIHTRKGFRWVNPVHEVLKKDMRLPKEKQTFIQDTLIKHYPDNSKPRSQYLPLLELSVKENPLDDRGLHYYGRELYFYKKYPDAIYWLEEHLKISKWNSERAASCRYIANSLWELNDQKKAMVYLVQGTREAPNEREPWVALAQGYRSFGRWTDCLDCCNKALAITERPNLYLNDPIAWSDWPEKMKQEALTNIL